ncbi:MAG: class I SAM-dependent methyltransferase, partial [Pirellulales bacterium]|nr:class I SAM-dependent methyltransferase [Pirellulales bacterium]
MRDFLPRQFRRAKRVLGRITGYSAAAGPRNGEREADWYSHRYAASVEYHKHYCQSVYYGSWTVIADRLRDQRVSSILDIGCGPGQFGALLKDQGFSNYKGLDFSSEAIAIARQNCPTFEFAEADIFQDQSLEVDDYDAIVSLEFLEHVERDLDVLRRIRPQTLFIGSVPNFPSESHVRCFKTFEEVS